MDESKFNLPKQELPNELSELYGFYTLRDLDENSLYHEYEKDASKFIANIDNTEEKKKILEALKKNISKNILKESEFEGFNNFCIALKNLLEAKA